MWCVPSLSLLSKILLFWSYLTQLNSLEEMYTPSSILLVYMYKIPDISFHFPAVHQQIWAVTAVQMEYSLPEMV